MENALGISVSRFRVLFNNMEQQPKVINIPRTHQGGGAHPQNTQDDQPTVNEQLLCGADENCRNPSTAKEQQRNLLKVYFNHFGVLA